METADDPIELAPWKLCRVWVLQQQGNREKAYRQLQQIAEKHSDSARVQMWMVELLLGDARHQEALDKATTLIKEFGMTPDQHFRLARILRGHGHRGLTLEIALKLTGNSDAGAAAHRLAADIYLEKGLPLRAEHHVHKALELDPNDPLALTLAGRVAYRRKQYMEARRRLKRALEHQPDYAHAYFLLGLTEYAMEDISLAAANLKKACDLGPQSGKYHYYHGRSLAGLEKWDEAEKAFKRAAELMNDPVQPLTDLGILAEEQGETERAIVYYRRAVLANRTRAAVAYNNLADIMLSRGQAAPLALALAHTAQAMSPASTYADTADTYADALIRSGLPAAAVRPARVAAEHDPESALAQLRLGMAEAAVGNREKAIAAVKKSQDLAQTEKMRKRARALLENITENLPDKDEEKLEGKRPPAP
jgi:tetratricopeptide (TPR) repeat protein